mmetsp:Transcript_31213/g.99178  ORF Transcript_31213/g.99178 Transcript_31213/m.99178 type:complete len:336 (-) Transcript_31213:861-1868(-)
MMSAVFYLQRYVCLQHDVCLQPDDGVGLSYLRRTDSVHAVGEHALLVLLPPRRRGLLGEGGEVEVHLEHDGVVRRRVLRRHPPGHALVSGVAHAEGRHSVQVFSCAHLEDAAGGLTPGEEPDRARGTLFPRRVRGFDHLHGLLASLFHLRGLLASLFHLHALVVRLFGLLAASRGRIGLGCHDNLRRGLGCHDNLRPGRALAVDSAACGAHRCGRQPSRLDLRKPPPPLLRLVGLDVCAALGRGNLPRADLLLGGLSAHTSFLRRRLAIGEDDCFGELALFRGHAFPVVVVHRDVLADGPAALTLDGVLQAHCARIVLVLLSRPHLQRREGLDDV